MKINIQIGSENFTAVLYDEVAAQEFFTQMPMTLSMNELNGNEKFYYLPEGLTTNSQKVGKVNNGDLMLFGSDCLVLFYKPFSTPYNYTKIGYIENPSGLAEALGKGNVEITLNKNN